MRTVLALLCGVTLLGVAGCGVAGGVEVAGGASQVTPPPPPPTLPSGTPASADPVAILREDPQLDDKLKAEIVPCQNGAYPVDDRYVDLTGDGKAELIITLSQCPSDEPEPKKGVYTQMAIGSVGYAVFVYNLASDPPNRLLTVEDSAVEAVTSKVNVGLIVIRERWGPRDDPCCPTDQVVTTYVWDGTKFNEVPR